MVEKVSPAEKPKGFVQDGVLQGDRVFILGYVTSNKYLRHMSCFHWIWGIMVDVLGLHNTTCK